MRRGWVATLLFGGLLGLLGCEGGDVRLVVELKTDYVPSVEFSFARAYLVEPTGEVVGPAVPGTLDIDFSSGYRMAEFGGLQPGSHQVRVELRDAANAILAAQPAVVDVRATTVAVVVIGRSCRGLECPQAGGDPGATACLNGGCVPPECVTGDREGCTGSCTADAQCPAAVDCVRPVCVQGECLAVPLDTCASGTFCHPDLGCVALPGSDAGVEDAGAVDAGRPDAGLPDAGPSCVPGVEVCNGRDDDCNTVVDEDTCAANETCAGADGCQCQAGWFDCGPSPGCETAESADDCGRCGNDCRGGTPVCDTASDTCVSGCGTGVVRCGGACVSTMTDPMHCGGCDQACSTNHGTPFCTGGACGIRCDPGWDDCDGDVTNGCEQTLTTATHCGSCGNPCGIAHTVTSCATGVCTMTGCEALYDDCDGIASNGCEQYLDTREHCGACGAGCLTNESCGMPGTCDCGADGSGPSGTGASVCNDWLAHTASGRCSGAVPSRCVVVTCDAGWGNCDGANYNGCETPLGTDANCASCGNTCTGPDTCMSGTCG